MTTYRHSFRFYLLKLTEVTQEMIDKSQSHSMAQMRISDTDLSGDRYIVLKFDFMNIPLIMETDHADDIISHSDLIIELGGSIWQV